LLLRLLPRVALKLGARKIGVQIDAEDGPEDVFLLG
jgi:hypothetical protein